MDSSSQLLSPRSENSSITADKDSSSGFVGMVEVFIHQARDIQNICIYHKQDVYAKLSLTNDPLTAVTSQIINGGGKNPVFNDTVRLDVTSVEESSLRCELYMMSRVKNYLQDQLLGFCLVPLSDVVVANGKLAQEFSLSSNDLFHSPAGFIQLSVSFFGSSPQVMEISAAPRVEKRDETSACELDKIEFLDVKMVSENRMMVSECFGMDFDNSESLIGLENIDDSLDDNAGVRVVESFSTTAENSLESFAGLKPDSPSVNGATSGIDGSSQSFSSSSGKKDKVEGGAVENEVDSSDGGVDNAFATPAISINIEPEHLVVQQDIVDMYMKSMQQFTESLAKMKLPMDIENGGMNSENRNSGQEQKLQGAKGNGSKVFYGSRAFF